MDQAALNELNSIKSELRSIMRELDSISDGIRYDFKNIGNEKCADCIDRVRSEYSNVLRKLENIDTSELIEGRTYSNGGSSGGGGRSF